MARFTNDHSLLFPVARNCNIKAIRALRLVSIKSFVHCQGNGSTLCILLECFVSEMHGKKMSIVSEGDGLILLKMYSLLSQHQGRAVIAGE